MIKLLKIIGCEVISMVKLSIIVPVYNVEKYLEQCLLSLLGQNVDKESYEIICINDGSTDNSGEILDNYAKKYTNIRVINKENGGVSSARNTRIHEAKGKYIWFVDSDDFISQGSVKHIIDATEKFNPEFIKFYYKHVKEDVSYTDFWSNTAKTVTPKVYKGRTTGLNVCIIVSANIIKEHNIKFPTDMKYGEDILFSYYTFIHSQGKCWVYFDNCFYYYRDRENSAMNTRTSEIYTRRTHDLLYMSKIYKDAYDNRITEIPELLDNTKKRQYQALIGALTIMPRSSYNLKETMKSLKEEGLYPFPWLWWYTKNHRTRKETIVESFKLLFKFQPIYKLYYLIMKR